MREHFKEPLFQPYLKECLLNELKDIEKTQRFLTHEDIRADPEEIEDCHYEKETYSDRRMNSKNQHRERSRARPPPRKMFNKRVRKF